MNLLAVDTSSELISFAVVLKGKVIFDFNRRKKHAASRVIVYIKNALKRLGLSIKDFDVFCIGKGPGSFTGLRISFSIIKAFSISLGKPVISIGSFLGCAAQIKHRYERIAVISDARRNLVYGVPLRVKDGKIIRERKESLYKLDDFLERYKDYALCTYDSFLRDKVLHINRGIEFYPRDIWPKAKYLAILAKDYYLEKKFIPLKKLEPLYIYPRDCQVRRIAYNG